MIIDEVHQLSNDAFAALLKTLEEPPAHLVFVFATTDPQKLPDTIRSRTQRFDFARVPLRRVADRLIAIAAMEAKDPEGLRFDLAEDAALLIAHKSEGSMRDAVSALDQVISAGEKQITAELVRRVLGLADREVFFALGGAIVARDPKAALESLHQAFAQGLDARELAEGLAEHVRHLLILRIDPAGSDLVPATREELERMRAQAAGWSEADLLRLLRLASDVQWPLRESAQPLIHLEAAVAQMATLERGETIAELLARLEALEARLSGAPLAGAPRAAPGARGPAAPSPPMRGAADAPPPRGSAAGGSSRAGDPPAAPPSSSGGEAPRASHAPGAATMTAAAARPESATATAARASALATAEDPESARWLRAVESVGKRKRMLGAFLEACQFLGLTDGAVTLGMDDLHRAVIEEKENRALTLEELARAFGRPLTLSCVPLGTEAVAAAPRDSDLNPMIDQTIRWFEGDILSPPARATERNRP